ncbi:unnamed protein product [Eruca vesicaria subsp. sativa]|uniref:Uncharacterized protein n=1 Tax=Eruca vesicaria subsp. sativa TaxID=29727 RepID=A0ABC8K5N0_ERUVS|nr:unnamed protein product [Eruca vesicaria subsp. sativa]
MLTVLSGDSEEIHCAALPLCLFVGPIFFGGPSSPLAEAHRPSLDGRDFWWIQRNLKFAYNGILSY